MHFTPPPSMQGWGMEGDLTHHKVYMPSIGPDKKIMSNPLLFPPTPPQHAIKYAYACMNNIQIKQIIHPYSLREDTTSSVHSRISDLRIFWVNTDSELIIMTNLIQKLSILLGLLLNITT